MLEVVACFFKYVQDSSKMVFSGKIVFSINEHCQIDFSKKDSAVDNCLLGKMNTGKWFSEHCTQVHFVSFFSGRFTTMTVINPPERKLAKRTSVCSGMTAE